VELVPEFKQVPLDAIVCQSDRVREANLDVGDLADSIARQGLQEAIGVKRDGLSYVLIWGRRRLEAFRTNSDRLGPAINAMVYPEDLADEWARILEIDENARRQDLTQDERVTHTIRLAAEIKSLIGSEFEGKPQTGRGNKGIIQKIAEIRKVDQAAVRRHAERAAEAIDEPVDLQKDSPGELTRKAKKFKEKTSKLTPEERRESARRRKLEKELAAEEAVRADLRQVLEGHGLIVEDFCELAEVWGGMVFTGRGSRIFSMAIASRAFIGGTIGSVTGLVMFSNAGRSTDGISPL
jgi:hypothetical protein